MAAKGEMVAGSEATRWVATLLACATGTAGTIPLFAELDGVGTDREESASKPCGIEERPHNRQADDRKDRPEERSRDPWDHVHVSNNAQGW